MTQVVWISITRIQDDSTSGMYRDGLKTNPSASSRPGDVERLATWAGGIVSTHLPSAELEVRFPGALLLCTWGFRRMEEHEEGHVSVHVSACAGRGQEVAGSRHCSRKERYAFRQMAVWLIHWSNSKTITYNTHITFANCALKLLHILHSSRFPNYCRQIIASGSTLSSL